MTAHQLVMDLAVRTARGRDSFFVAPPNALALQKIDNWQAWAGGKLALTGPEGSGKSHLVAVWAELSGAHIIEASDIRDGAQLTGPVAVENVDRIAGNASAEEALFHLHNRVLGASGALLMSGRETPDLWPIALPDLKSRILAADIARLGPPDDALLAAVLVKIFDDRQLHVSPDVIKFIITRTDRSFAEAERVVARLDRASIRERKKISLRFAASVLKETT